jgi:hypothetical protein
MTSIRHIATLGAALVAVAALTVPAAAAASSDDVIKDCYEDGKLDRNYSRKDLKEAERNMPSDVDEYSDCRAVIRAAQLAAAGHGKHRPRAAAAGGGRPRSTRRSSSSAS